MAYDSGLAQILRDALGDRPVTEKRMFGGLAFLLYGHMLCGVHRGGAMFRVGKAHYAAALSLQGVTEMAFTGRPMTGFVECDDSVLESEPLLDQLLQMALSAVADLPPKVAKPPKG